MKIIIYSLLMLMFVNVNLFAEENKTQDEKDKLVLKKALELMNGLLSPTQYSELHILSYSAVAANYCDGIDIDKAKYEEGLKLLEPEKGDKMTEEEKESYANLLMFNYGLTVGVYLHEGAEDLEKFCSEAWGRMKDEKINHYWTVVKASDKPK